MPRGCLRFVIVVFPDRIHLLFLKSECAITRYLKRKFPVKMGGGGSFTIVAFTWQDGLDMMDSNESVKLLFMIPVLIYKTSQT